MQNNSPLFSLTTFIAGLAMALVSSPAIAQYGSAARLPAPVTPDSQASGQRTFATPQQAASALLTAAQADDVAAILVLFGPDGEDIVHSGDPFQDRNNLSRFVERAKRSMKVKVDPANRNRATIVIDEDDYPFPVPLIKAAGQWRFDTPTGRTEILARRIGRNELDAIEAAQAYVAAQLDYAAEDRNKNGVPEYARKLISSPGQHDGLFWPDLSAPPTEFAEGVAKAESEGYRKVGNTRTPYHGYYFKILTAQGPNVKGGALDYVQHDMMIGGFGLVAWPAEYGVSGIKTFIVDRDGIVYEKDLGPSTDSVAEAMTVYNPDKTWSPAPSDELQSQR
jgi:hypothetical protein